MTHGTVIQFKRLLALHLVLAVAPIATFLGPANVRFLLVVRSHGYRLVGKRFAEPPEDASAADDSQTAGITARCQP